MALAPSVPDRNCDLSAALLPACHDPVQQEIHPHGKDEDKYDKAAGRAASSTQDHGKWISKDQTENGADQGQS